MDFIYAPWRKNYSAQTHAINNCPFCTQLAEDNDRDNLILKRTSHCIIMMNKYPYNKGHLLVIPHSHVRQLNELSNEARYDLMETINNCVVMVQEALECDGVNVGINIGKVSGGSIESHIHIHVIPRFLGDTNFLAVAGKTKVVTYDLFEIYDWLKISF